MATIREKKPGVWEVRLFTGRDEEGRPTQVSTTVRGSRREAARVAAELTVRPSRSGTRTVADLLDEWLALHVDTWAPSTARDQASRVKAIKGDPIARMRLAKLSVADVDRWYARQRRAGKGEPGLRNQRGVLRAAMTQALRWGWLSSNPAALAAGGRQKTVPRGSLSADEVRRVIEAATAYERTAGLALRLAAVTGARRAELAALRWEDFDGRRVAIDSSVAIVRHGSASDRRAPTLRDDPTKTANRRTVTVDSGTAALLVEMRAERERYGPWILNVGEQPANPERMTHWWARARQIAGLDPKWRLHDLRHWSATLAIGSGHDLRTVANRLGHANPAMTLRVYAHAFEPADEGVAETLGQVLDQ